VSDDKSEEPTEKKLNDAREEGNVAKSNDLTSVAAFAAAMGVLKATWVDFETMIKELFAFSIDHIAHPANLELATSEIRMLALRGILLISLPIAAGAAAMAALVDIAQVGPMFAAKAIMPKLENIDPIKGLQNFVSKKQLVETTKSMLKLFITGYVVYGVVRDAMAMVVATVNGDAPLTMLVMGELVYRVTQKVVLLLIGFAIVDVWWQRISYMKQMMMSKDEVKREYKQSEGDPHHKHKRKELHMEILEGAQMESVKKADVVVTNPDHLAVALQYDKERDQAPRVIAKGMNLRAEKIKEIAKSYDVAMMRNIPLAHALHRVEVNQEIPEDLYDAVAEVLNFVYQLKETTAASS
jgi:flagellar biosynthetic protein FlhB